MSLSLVELKILRTSYYPIGQHKFARIRVIANHQTPWFFPCDALRTVRDNHIAAVQDYAKARDWKGKWALTAITEKGYIFIPICSETTIDIA